MTGTLAGHVMPGILFIITALWRLVQTVRRLQLLRLAGSWSLVPPRPTPERVSPGAIQRPRVSRGAEFRGYESGSHESGSGSHESGSGSLSHENGSGSHLNESGSAENVLGSHETGSRSPGMWSESGGNGSGLPEGDEQLLDDSDNTAVRESYDDTEASCDVSSDVIDHWRFYTSVTFPCYSTVGCRAGFGGLPLYRWPVEGIFKVVVTLAGISGQVWAGTGYGAYSSLVWMEDIQHLTMYALFLVSGLVDLACWSGRVGVVPGVEYLAFSHAYTGEWLLFSLHNHMKDELDLRLHKLLLLTIAAPILTILLEYKYPHSLPASLSTTFFMFLQGTWFIQVGLILTPPSPDWFVLFSKSSTLDLSSKLILVTIIFALNVLGGFILLSGLFIATSLLLERYAQLQRWNREHKAMVERCAAELVAVTSESIAPSRMTAQNRVTSRMAAQNRVTSRMAAQNRVTSRRIAYTDIIEMAPIGEVTFA